jgi:hypothetical protein
MEEDYNEKIQKMNMLLENNTELEEYLKMKSEELNELKYLFIVELVIFIVTKGGNTTSR